MLFYYYQGIKIIFKIVVFEFFWKKESFSHITSNEKIIVSKNLLSRADSRDFLTY